MGRKVPRLEHQRLHASARAQQAQAGTVARKQAQDDLRERMKELSCLHDVVRMTEALAPRGPDGSGIVLRGSVGLGHRRLKIIDLSEKAQQPMVDPELGLTLTFNG